MSDNSKQIKALLQMRGFRRAISGEFDENSLLMKLLNETVAALDASGGIIFLLDENRIIRSGNISSLPQPDLLPAYCSHILQQAREASNDLLVHESGRIGTGLWSARQSIGLIMVCERQSEAGTVEFDVQDQALLIALAATASIALDKYAIEQELLLSERSYPSSEIEGLIRGSSAAVQEVRKQVEILTNATGNVSALILGENGVGKELVAEAIRIRGPYQDGNHQSVNCKGFTKELLRSELFGHERGAFTGAVSRKIGLMEAANNGVLFLDEIGELDLELQGVLLRALETRKFKRVGGLTDIESDFQLVCATNRDLKEAISQGQFREDLYYRIAEFEIYVPPLRERLADIEELIQYFLKHFNDHYGKSVNGFSQRALHNLKQHTWPGNIRELRNVVSRGVLRAPGAYVDNEHLDAELQEQSGDQLIFDSIIPLKEAVANYVRFAYNKMRQHTTQTMEILGIDYRQLMRHLGKRIDEHLTADLQDGVELEIVERAESIMRIAGIPPEKQRAAKRGIIESVINAVEHSQSQDNKLKVDFEVTARLFRIKVRDFGLGFDPDSVPKVDATSKIRSRVSRGWGLHIIRESVDLLDIKSGSTGTTVVMTINR